jgi:hypothetical protein
MMRTIGLEVRDTGTFIAVVAVRMESANEGQRYLLRRCGYSPDHPAVVLFRMNGDGHAFSDPYSWTNRTMQGAHLYIEEHFNELQDGDVVDVEFHVLGETSAPKISERFSDPI